MGTVSDQKMRRLLALPRVGQVLLVLLSGALVVLLASQVGRERESLILALVGGTFVLVLAVIVPAFVLLIGGVLVFLAGYSVVGIPLPEIGALLIILGILLGGQVQWRLPSLLLFTLAPFAIWVIFVSWGELSDPLVNKRFLSLMLWLLLIAALSLPSRCHMDVARGLLIGLFLSFPASILIGSGYGDRGAGLVGDPNAFSMVVVLTTPLIVGALRLERWQAVGVWSIAAAAVITADSRTGIASLLVAAVVFAVLPRLRALALGVPLLAVSLSAKVPEDITTGGRWEDRQGSDLLRERIDAASERQIAESPWSGHGLASGRVDLNIYGEPRQDATFFLHNSYKSLVTELGLVGLGLYAALVAAALWHALSGGINRGAVAALAAGAVMGSQLGEVLLAIPMAIALGFAWGSSGDPQPPSNDQRAEVRREPQRPADSKAVSVR